MAEQTVGKPDGNVRDPVTLSRSNGFVGSLIENYQLYLLFLPGLLLFLTFRYGPMYGLVIAFKEFNIFRGIAQSEWVGLLQFQRLFRSPTFPQVLANTLLISFGKLIFGFPAPIILALLLNEVRKNSFKRFAQTVIYLPHFISWVVFAGIIIAFLNPVNGLVNQIRTFLGQETIYYLARRDFFRGIIIFTDIYKEAGWGTIVYLAAISGVDPNLYEAATMDGAGRLRQMAHITIPSIASIIVILFILRLGSIMQAGFHQIFMLYNPLVYETGDVISTFVYRKGLLNSSYSLGAAAGMFRSVISLLLIVTTNRIARWFGESGLW